MSRAHPTPEEHRHGAREYFFRVWEKTEAFVPNPWLYTMVFFHRPGCPASGLESLRCFEFVYRVTTDFVARVTGEQHDIARVSLERESMGFRLNTINGRNNLITPETAEQRIIWHFEDRLRKSALREAAVIEAEEEEAFLVERFWELPWTCLRLDHPLKAGSIEPVYLFLKADCRWEFRVGARSGAVSIVRQPTSS